MRGARAHTHRNKLSRAVMYAHRVLSLCRCACAVRSAVYVVVRYGTVSAKHISPVSRQVNEVPRVVDKVVIDELGHACGHTQDVPLTSTQPALLVESCGGCLHAASPTLLRHGEPIPSRDDWLTGRYIAGRPCAPGSFDTRASLSLFVMLFMSEDLPTFDLPMTANSAYLPLGQSATAALLLASLDEVILVLAGGGRLSSRY